MRVFSGIQPSGNFHIGNYLGALRQFKDLQDQGHTTLFSIVDLHALTSNPDKGDLQEFVQTAQKTFLAIGLDPEKSVLFVQSRVPEHTQLAWVFATLTSLGDLERMTQFKDKKAQGIPSTAGLFTYPILMASDILLYNADAVPVGEDQEQHIELTRTIARKFNNGYGEIFTVPKTLTVQDTARVMSLADPTKKMSKSLGEGHYVGIMESEDAIRSKFKRAVTDSANSITYDPATKPGVSNLLSIYAGMQQITIDEAVSHFSSSSYVALKEEVAEQVITQITPIQERFHSLSESDIQNTFSQGAQTAQEYAHQTLQKVFDAIGV